MKPLIVIIVALCVSLLLTLFWLGQDLLTVVAVRIVFASNPEMRLPDSPSYTTFVYLRTLFKVALLGLQGYATFLAFRLLRKNAK